MTKHTLASLHLHTGKAVIDLQPGQLNKFKAKAGEHYRVIQRRGQEEQLLDNVIAKRSGDDLLLSYEDGTQVALENYYSECKALLACDLTLPGADGGLYRPGLETASGIALADGSVMVYAHGAPDSLRAMAQSDTAQARVLAGLQGKTLTYLPSDASALAVWPAAALLAGVAGSQSSASAASVAKDTTAPSASLLTAMDNEGAVTGLIASGGTTDDTSLLLSGTTEAGATVAVYNGNTFLGFATVSGSSWTYIATVAGGTTYQFNARATDAAGNTSVATPNYTVIGDTTGPSALSVVLDQGDDGNAENGVELRVNLMPGTEVGVSITTLIKRDAVPVETITGTLVQADIDAGYRTVPVAAASVGADGSYSASVELTDAAGNRGNVVSNTAAFTVFTGLVHDDYLANAFVFVDSNRDGRYNEGEAKTLTDASGKFKFAFNPNGAPVLAMGGVDTASGAPNSGVVYRAYTGAMEASAAGVDIVLSPLSSLIAAVADQSVASGQVLDDAALRAAAATVNTVLRLGSSDPGSLLTFDPVASSQLANASAADLGLMSANRQLGLLFSAAAAVVDGAATQDDAPTGTGSALGISALAGLVLARQQQTDPVSLSETADVEATLQRTMDASNASGYTQDLRASTPADLTLLSSVVGGFNARLDTSTQAGAQSLDAIATMRAASDQLLPMLSQSGSEAASDRGGDISLSGSLATLNTAVHGSGQGDVAAYVKAQTDAVSQVSAVFEANTAKGHVGKVIRLDIQLPSVGLSDMVDSLTLSGLPAGVQLLKVNPLTGLSTVVQPDGAGVYSILPQDVGYLAVRSESVVQGTLSLAATNLVGSTLTQFAGSLAVEIGAEPVVNRVTLSAVTDDVGAVTGALTKGVRTDDALPTLTGSLSLALQAGESVAVYDGNIFLGNATVSGQSWSFTPSTPLLEGSHGLSARVLVGAQVKSASSLMSLTVDTQAPPAPPLFPSDGRTVAGTAEPGARVQVYSAGAVIGQAIADASGAWSIRPAQPLADGALLSATATDEAGWVSPASSGRVEFDAPVQVPSLLSVTDDVARMVGTLQSGAVSNDPNPTLQGKLSAALTGGELLRVLDGGVEIGLAQVSGTNWSFTPTLALAQGAHNFKVQVVNGNKLGAASAEFPLTIDTLAPAAPVISAVATDDLITASETRSVVTGSAEPGASLALTLGAGNVRTVLVDAQGTWSYTLTPADILAMGQGNETLSATASDAAGNISAAGTRAIRIDTSLDTTPPAPGTLTFGGLTDTGSSASDGITQDGSFSLSVVGNEAGSTLSYEVSTDGGTTWAPTTASQSALADGSYSFRATATDAAGNKSTGNSASVTVDSTAPAAGTLSFTGLSDSGCKCQRRHHPGRQFQPERGRQRSRQHPELRGLH